MGGWLGSVYYSNDTWRFQPAGSTEQNPTHIYTTPGNLHGNAAGVQRRWL